MGRWTKVPGGEAALTLFEAPDGLPRADVVARLDLDAPAAERGWCRVAGSDPKSPTPSDLAAQGSAQVTLRGNRPCTVTVLHGAETLLEAAFLPVKDELAAHSCAGLRGDERVLVRDAEERGRARLWQLPGLSPQARVQFPDGTACEVELRVTALQIDLARGNLALFWSGSVLVPRHVEGAREADCRLDCGFAPAVSIARIAQELAPLPRSPACALPIDHTTRFEAATFPWQLVPPTDVEIVVVKGTFDLVDGGPARLAEKQEPLSGERLHEGGGSLAYPGDFVPYKPRTDVLVLGHAHAKPGAAVARVELRVGSIAASVVAMGPRTWLPGGHPSEPAPFEGVPLRYEHAFGGPGVPENPAGVGLAPGSPPPSIELAGALLRKRGDRPAPAGFGPLARDWAPRKALLGTFTKDWVASRWPYLPDDFNHAFWNAAPAALTAEALRGDEAFRITSVREGGGNLEGHLPGVRPRCFAERAGHELSEVPLRLDTVIFDADRSCVVLVWRGAIETSGGASAERSALRRLVLLAEPLDVPLSIAEIQHRIELGPRTAPPAARPSPVAGMIFGVKTAPRVSRAQVERWIAAGERLAGRDLSGADLSGMDLSGQDLSGAILRGTVLDDAKLDGVHAEGLRAAGVIARRSHWMGAKLVRADFAGACLDGADLSDATLSLASFADAELAGLIARRAAAASVQFVRAQMAGAVLDNASLQKANFSGATLDGARFAGGQLDDARFYEALGEGLVADRASLIDARFEAAQLDRASFREVRARGSMWERASLAGADFTLAELVEAGFAGANLTRARFAGADLTGARLRTAVLTGASFVRANLMRANLEGVAAAGADFTGANLYQAETWRARLEGAKLTGANVKGTKLVEASSTPRRGTSRGQS